MVKKVAQRAIAAGLAGMMSLGALAPAAMAIDGTTWSTLPWWSLTPTSDDDGLVFWKRIKGDTRYDTMKKILEACYVSGTADGNRWINASEAVIASGENFPDALAANGLAGTLNNGKGAPVILTKKGALSSQAKDVLEKMQVQHVYIMGGTNTISQEVEDAIAKLKIATTRVAGSDRQETSLKAFNLISGNWYKNYGTHSVIIATGATYADSLSIAPFAYQTGTPIVLTQADGTLTQAQIDAIKDNDEIYNIIVVGGEKSVNPSAFSLVGTFNKKYGFNYTGVRIDGADRYETSANIADWEVNYAKSAYNRIIGKDQGGSNLEVQTGVAVTNVGDCYFDWDFTFVATGEKFPDALAGAQLAGGSYMNARGTGYIAHTNKQGNKEGFISGSPILLTKEGDRTAEMAIARNLAAWNSNKYYASSRALYADWFDLNKTTGMTPQEFAENYLTLGFFSVNPMTSAATTATTGIASNWAGQVESNVWNRVVYRDGKNIGVVVPVWNGTAWVLNVIGYNNVVIGTVNAAMNSLTPANGGAAYAVTTQNATLNVVSDGNQVYGVIDPTDNAAPFNVLDVQGNLIGTSTVNTGAGVYTATGKAPVPVNVTTGRYVYGADSDNTFSGMFGITDYDANVDPAAGVYHILSYDGNTGTYNVDAQGLWYDTFTMDFNGRTYRVDVKSPSETVVDGTTSFIVNTTPDIYIYKGTKKADSNFHGIIFGGTASVSKKKAEDLDKVVKDTITSDVASWEWDFVDRPSSILNTSLLGNVFWTYRSGAAVSENGNVLNHFYAPAIDDPTYYANYSNVSLADAVIDYAKYINDAYKDGRVLGGNGVIYNSAAACTAAGQTIVGKVGKMDFYHFTYVQDPVTRITDWAYSDKVTMNFVVDMNSGVMTALPWFV